LAESVALPKAGGRAQIRPVVGPRRAWLELKGTVLIYHRRGWVGSQSVFIPVEWVSITERQRLDSKYLLVGLPALALALVLQAPLLRAASTTSWGESHWPALIAGGALALWAFAVVFVVLAFLRRRPTTLIAVDSEPARLRIEFWHRPTDDPNLDSLVGSLKSLRERIHDMMPYPVQSGHTWYRLRPFRATLFKGLFISIILCVPIAVLGWLTRTPYVEFLLLLPPVFYMSIYGMNYIRMLSAPRLFREALRCYNRGETAPAREKIERALAEHPDYMDANLLGIYVSVELQDFERAFGLCRKVSAINPEVGEEIAKELWSLRRMHDRMNVEA
jgi:hypothetical protein